VTKIHFADVERRKSAGECLRCAWPSDRKGSHRVKDCIRPIKLNKGTASYPKAKEYHKMKIAGIELYSEDSESEDSDGSEQPEESDTSDSEEEVSEGEYLDEEGPEKQEDAEAGNWWDLPSDSD
jgi:hypothetical protein